MQIAIIMLIYLLFLDQILGGEQVSEGEENASGVPCGRKPVREVKTTFRTISML